MMATPERIETSQAAFNDRTLKRYDWLLEVTCNRIWRCPVERTLELYHRHLSSNHLEVGVGTGYFLDRSHQPGPNRRLALLDLNPHCLKHAEARLARHIPEVYRANAPVPIELDVRRFDSIAINSMDAMRTAGRPASSMALIQ